MGDWFNPTQWTQVPFEDEMKSALAIGFVIVFAVGFVVSLMLYFRLGAAMKAHPIKRAFVKRYTSWLMWAFGFGLVFYLFQLMGLPFLGWRVWAWISVALVVVALAAIPITRTRRYLPQLKAYEAQQAKRYYQQQSRKRPVGSNGQPIPRSPRAEKRRQRTGGPTPRGR
jgi:MFS superfamily sulfate permease-like transporter